MIYVEATSESWSKKHQLEVETIRCAKCGKNFKTTVPFLMKGYAGLETPTHSCGRNFNSIIIVPTSQDEINNWAELLAN